MQALNVQREKLDPASETETRGRSRTTKKGKRTRKVGRMEEILEMEGLAHWRVRRRRESEPLSRQSPRGRQAP